MVVRGLLGYRLMRGLGRREVVGGCEQIGVTASGSIHAWPSLVAM